MPAGFEYLRPYDAFVSIGPFAGSRQLLSRGNHNGLNAVGRLKPGMTAAMAAPALKTLAANLEQAYPVEQKDQTFMIEGLSRFSLSTSPSSGRKAHIR